DVLPAGRRVRLGDCQRSDAATSIQSSRNPKCSRAEHLEAPERGSPTHHRPIWVGEHPNLDDYRMRQARTIRRYDAIAVRSNDENRRNRKAEKPSPDPSRALDRISQLIAEAQKTGAAAPNGVLQP